MNKLITVIVSVVIGVLAAWGAIQIFPGLALFEAESTSENTQIVDAVTRQEQVVLLSLGIQGISEKNEKSKFLGLDIPGSARASFIQYAFTAKLGIDGKDVEVVKTGDTDYLVFIPEFIFIGHDDETFKLVAEKNGLLSAVTPKIDGVEVVTSILNDDAQNGYVEANIEILQDQAKVFYTSIITSIDPSITIRFEFRQGPR